MNSYDSIAHSLKIRFGLRKQPTLLQLEKIFEILLSFESPTAEDLASAVEISCPDYNTVVYGGVDNSNLNTLLMMAIEAAKNLKGKRL